MKPGDVVRSRRTDIRYEIINMYPSESTHTSDTIAIGVRIGETGSAYYGIPVGDLEPIQTKQTLGEKIFVLTGLDEAQHITQKTVLFALVFPTHLPHIIDGLKKYGFKVAISVDPDTNMDAVVLTSPSGCIYMEQSYRYEDALLKCIDHWVFPPNSPYLHYIKEG